jgi:hypothetical protein
LSAQRKNSVPIPRRKFLSSVAGAGILTAAPRFTLAEAQTERTMPIPRIKDISVIECELQGVRLTVVKITTDQDGLCPRELPAKTMRMFDEKRRREQERVSRFGQVRPRFQWCGKDNESSPFAAESTIRTGGSSFPIS